MTTLDTLDTEIEVCACCGGAGVLWVFGGPVVCPHCGGYGEGTTIEAPLGADEEKLL